MGDSCRSLLNFCGFSLNQEQGNEAAEFEDSSSGEDETARGEPERFQHQESLSPGDSAASDEDDSEYEDCQEEEEEGWQTCLEEDSADEESRGQGWKQDSVGSGAQGRQTPPTRQVRNFNHLVSKQELLEILKELHTGKRAKAGQLTVGLVRCSGSERGWRVDSCIPQLLLAYTGTHIIARLLLSGIRGVGGVKDKPQLKIMDSARACIVCALLGMVLLASVFPV